jgi:hypothetical protein
MKEAFNTVRGAVSQRDLLPVLTHFAVSQGRIHGYNGRVHISAPAPSLAHLPGFTVPAQLALAALDACGEAEPVLEMAGDKVRVTDGANFSAVLPIGPIDAFPISPVPAKCKKLGNAQLLPVLRALRPFVGEDASRPWCASIKFHGAVAMATNNVAMAAMGLPKSWPLTLSCALPVFTVDELLRIGEEPVAVAPDGDHALFFYLPQQVWLRTVLVADGWPNAMAVLHSAHAGAVMRNIPAGLLAAVQHVLPFCPDPHVPAIVLDKDQVTTQQGVSTARVAGFSHLAGTYHATPLQLVLAAATGAAWDKAPRVPWKGPGGLDGVLMGMGGTQSAP